MSQLPPRAHKLAEDSRPEATASMPWLSDSMTADLYRTARECAQVSLRHRGARSIKCFNRSLRKNVRSQICQKRRADGGDSDLPRRKCATASGVRPRLIAHFEVLELAGANHVRHIKFGRMRYDKEVCGSRVTREAGRPCLSGSGFIVQRGEPCAPKRSFRPGSPARNFHRSGATHVPLPDGEGDSADNLPYRLCSSLPAESLSPSSILGAACKFCCRDDPGPDDPGPRQACRLAPKPGLGARMLLVYSS
jgi:hypothetical protein